MAEPVKSASKVEEPQVPTEKYVEVKAGPQIERRIPKSSPKSTSDIRTVKMMQPICSECQWPPRPRWWERCPHDPYFSDESEEIVEPVLEEDENGDFLVKGETTKIRVHRYPNTVQVALAENSNSGQGVELMRAKGCVMPSEFDLPEMCQYYDCWEENPKFRTIYGNYCTADQARLIGAAEEHVVLEVLEMTKRREQLRRIDISST